MRQVDADIIGGDPKMSSSHTHTSEEAIGQALRALYNSIGSFESARQADKRHERAGDDANTVHLTWAPCTASRQTGSADLRTVSLLRSCYPGHVDRHTRLQIEANTLYL
ncbi:hypothetical protein ACJJTC_001173 [Scirpophaga incertulas]